MVAELPHSGGLTYDPTTHVGNMHFHHVQFPSFGSCEPDVSQQHNQNAIPELFCNTEIALGLEVFMDDSYSYVNRPSSHGPWVPDFDQQCTGMRQETATVAEPSYSTGIANDSTRSIHIDQVLDNTAPNQTLQSNPPSTQT